MKVFAARYLEEMKYLDVPPSSEWDWEPVDSLRIYASGANTNTQSSIYADRNKLTYAVQDVLKDIEDWRAVSWVIDDMANHKPSNLSEILEAREAKFDKKYNFAKKVQDYNQPNPTPQKAKEKNRQTRKIEMTREHRPPLCPRL